MTLAEFEATRRYVETAFGRIAFIEHGQGAPAVFLHAFGLNGIQWRDVIPALAPTTRGIAIDLLGMGHSDLASGIEPTLTVQARMVAATIDALNLGPVHLIGNDSGGGVAQIVAVERPELIRTMCLIDSEAHDNFPPEGLKPIIEAAHAGGLGGMYGALANDLTLARNAMGAALYKTPEITLSEDVAAAYFQPILRSESSINAFTRFVCAMDASHLTAIEAKLKTMQAPTLVLWGDADQVFPVCWGEWLRDTLPNTQFSIIADGALCWPEEQPQVLVDHLQSFWASA